MNIKEMFLKAANYRFVERPGRVGYRFEMDGKTYGNMLTTAHDLPEETLDEVREMFKEMALEALLHRGQLYD